MIRAGTPGGHESHKLTGVKFAVSKPITITPKCDEFRHGFVDGPDGNSALGADRLTAPAVQRSITGNFSPTNQLISFFNPLMP